MVSDFPKTAMPRRRVTLALALSHALVLCFLFGYLAAMVLAGDTAAFDRAVLLAIGTSDERAGFVDASLPTEIARDVSALGSFTVTLAFSLFALGYLSLVRQRLAALFLTISVLGGAALNTILKHIIERPRPDILPHATEVFTSSFPSAHATMSVVTYLTLAILAARWQPQRPRQTYILVVATLFIIGIGLSRPILGVHYPTDLLGGWSIGAAWVLLCWVFVVWLARKRTRNAVRSA